MTAPFTIQPSLKPGLLDRVLRRRSQAASALREINNLLACAPRPSGVSHEDLCRIAEAYQLDPSLRCARQLQEMYATYLQHCLSDWPMSDEEVEDLAHLKRLFGLSDTEVGQIHDQVAERVYGESVAAAMADGRLSAEEHAFLRKLRTELRLSDEIANQITSRHAQHRLGEHLNEALADQRLSPGEERELYAIARSFGTVLETDEQTRNALHHYRLYWLIENGHLPEEVNPGIHLERGEVCHAIYDVDWYKMRTPVRRVNRRERSTRVRIAIALTHRLGTVSAQPVTEDVMKPIDSGRVFLTNQRLIFRGGQKHVTVALKRILRFTPFSNGVAVQRKFGKSLFLRLGKNADLFALTLERIIRESA